MSAASYDLTTLEGFTAGFRAHKAGIHGLHCPVCAANRRMYITAYEDDEALKVDYEKLPDGRTVLQPPFVARLTCLECQTHALAVVFESPSGPDLAILWSEAGGLSSPHTPDAVRYYLDQAARSEAVGARSAAVAMYRAALEHLLLEQGYTAKMLGPKLKQVEAEIVAGTPKPWARDLAPTFMDVLRKLGNAAIHADSSDVSHQEAIDAALLADVHVAVEELLDLVYERPALERERLARLQAGADALKG